MCLVHSQILTKAILYAPGTPSPIDRSLVKTSEMTLAERKKENQCRLERYTTRLMKNKNGNSAMQGNLLGKNAETFAGRW